MTREVKNTNEVLSIKSYQIIHCLFAQKQEEKSAFISDGIYFFDKSGFRHKTWMFESQLFVFEM